MARRARLEEALQRAVASYLDVALPDEAEWWHTPSQRGTRNRYEMGILKVLGVRPGIPDVLILYRGQLIGIELKTPKGRLTPAQKVMRDRLMQAGALVAVCRSVDDVQAFLGPLVPLKARAA